MLTARYDYAAGWEYQTYVVFGPRTKLAAYEISVPHGPIDYRLVDQELFDRFRGGVKLDDCMIVMARSKSEAKKLVLGTSFARSSCLPLLDRYAFG